MSGPDANGYYTIKLTGVQIPEKATMLTGGVGYSYQITTTFPLTQVDLTDYPYDANTQQGGLMVPAPNVWKTATGNTPRRTIVDNAKCNDCHGGLGVAPTFHVGQRNDGPTCSFCHTPNRTSSGWSAGSKYFVHGVHGGRKRTVPFVWHATEPGPGYSEIEFPAPLNGCKGCHAPNTYDFTASANFNSIENQLLTTVAQNTYDPNASGYYTFSPYITADNTTDYGSGFSFKSSDGTSTEAAGTTLVITPIMTACVACHDSPAAMDHMKANGGQFYAPRSTALDPNAPKEQCMLCHGPGKVAAIGEVHQH